MKKIISRNVNWLRAVVNKWFFWEFLNKYFPDILWLQEIKVQPDQIDQFFLDWLREQWYYLYFNSAKRKWYSWTAIFTKQKPLNVFKWINFDNMGDNLWVFKIDSSLTKEIDNVINNDIEWRVLTAEFDKFFFTTVYVPNSKWDLSRLNFRIVWDMYFLNYMKELEKRKPVIFCWDFNVAHKEIDLKNPSANKWHHWFTDEERLWFSKFIDNWFVDTFRYLFPDKKYAYSWRSYLWNARKNNSWWRIDYILISKNILNNLKDAFILDNIFWSDHCPVWIDLKI